MSLFDRDKPIELFTLTKLTVLVGVFQEVVALGEKIGVERGPNDVFSVWHIAGEMANFIQANIDDPKGFPLDPIEENLIRLIDPISCRSFLDEFEKFETMDVVGMTPSSQPEGVGVTNLKDTGPSPEEMFSNMNIQDAIQQEWIAKLQNPAGSAQFEHVYNWYLDMAEQFMAVGSALGFLTPEVESYFYEELAGFLNPETIEYDPLRINRTFVEGRYQEDLVSPLTQLGLRVLDFGYTPERANYTWGGVFKFSLIVHFLFSRLSRLSDEMQVSLLISYLYKAMVVGVPVQQYLSETLYDTPNPELYIEKCRQFFESFEKNSEIIHFESGDPIVFKQIFTVRGINKTNGDVDAMLVSQSIEEILKEHKISQHQTWIQDAIFLYTKLRSISLIPNNRGGELPPEGEYVNDMIDLIAHVGINDAGDEFITNYYTQELPKVPLEALINTLKDVMKLEDKITQSNVLHLNELLKKEHLIEEDENLIVYDMNAKSFSWAM